MKIRCAIFGVCFFWPSNLGLLGRIPLSGCAVKKTLKKGKSLTSGNNLEFPAGLRKAVKITAKNG